MNRTEKILGWLYMAFSLLCLPAALTWVNGQLADPLDEATLNFVFYLTNFLFIAGIFHSLRNESNGCKSKKKKKQQKRQSKEGTLNKIQHLHSGEV